MAETRRGRVKVEPGAKRVRAYLGGHLVADTVAPILVWEKPYYPTYYFPVGDVRAELVANGEIAHSPSLGDATVYDVATPTGKAAGAARRYSESPLPELRELIRLEWAAMDAWFEEDEPVYVHPRDPYTRVDILASSRHVEVKVDGLTVADSHRPHILFETGLPPRYYLPITDLRMDLLEPSDRQTRCPYKGTATYWSVVVGGTTHEDVVWCYRTPVPESQKIAGLACFYNEKVDLYIDGELQEQARTHFS
jgi:uncharacterized protein (DUF427 family)